MVGFIDSKQNSIHSEVQNKGVIMAQGNIGSSLDPNNLNTYVSRNGVTIFKLGFRLAWGS